MKRGRALGFGLVLLATPPAAPGYNVPYDYVTYRDEAGIVPIPRTYETASIIRHIDAEPAQFDGALDLFIDESDTIFVADTGNDRILKMAPDGTVLQVYLGDEQGFNQPSGLFVDSYGDLFVADTENSRIVHLDSSGALVETFSNPESEILGEFFSYYPSKISLSPTGYLYVIKGTSIMTLDAHNRFRGYLGQALIGFDFGDWLVSRVATESQRERIINRAAAPFTNLFIAADGMIYATSTDPLNGEIKKITATGRNIFPRRRYGEVEFSADGMRLEPKFVDLTLSVRGIVSALDATQSKVYQYDQEGNLLAVFGGSGVLHRRFLRPAAIELDSRERLYILDAGSIHILEPTYFIRTVHDAVAAYGEGRYSEALASWREVQRMNESYRLAASGIARALYKQEAWGEALERYRIARDREGYSQTFVDYRHERLRSGFVLLVPATGLALFLLYRIGIGYRRLAAGIVDSSSTVAGVVPRSELLRLPVAMLARPAETLRLIRRYRTGFTLAPVAALLVLAVAVRVVVIYLTHFPLASIEPRDANILLETLKLYVPLATWVVSSYAVTSILDGEAEFREVLTASAFALVPYIVFAIPIAALSRLLCSIASERALFVFLHRVMFGWVVMLLVLGIRSLHDYGVAKTLSVSLLTLLGMALIWALLVLLFALSENLRAFVQGLFLEILMTLRFR